MKMERCLQISGVFRISKRGAKCSLDTSAHTNQVFQFFYYVKKKIFWPKGGHGPMAPLNTPLLQVEKFYDVNDSRAKSVKTEFQKESRD